MSKNALQGESEPAQPLLRGINLARFLTVQPTWCGCDCDGCPPWLHYAVECVTNCERLESPPMSNTGVHATLERGASESFSGRHAGPTRADK